MNQFSYMFILLMRNYNSVCGVDNDKYLELLYYLVCGGAGVTFVTFRIYKEVV